MEGIKCKACGYEYRNTGADQDTDAVGHLLGHYRLAVQELRAMIDQSLLRMPDTGLESASALFRAKYKDFFQ